MPYSSESGKSHVDRVLRRLDVRSGHVLDVGAGAGFYPDRYASSLLKRPAVRWTGLEIWEPYVERFNLRSKYDELVLADVRTCADLKRYDVVFLGDVLEHMLPEEAVRVVSHFCATSHVVICSLPIGHYPQEEYLGNPYERHVKDDWTYVEGLQLLPHVVWSGLEREIGVFVCSRDASVQQLLQATVAVYGVCKNELRFIERCVRSAAEADEVVFCDSGSADGTYEKLVELHVDAHRIHVSPWRYDSARNTCLSLVSPDVDVCVSLDADELLLPGWRQALDRGLAEHGPSRFNHRFRSVWDWEGAGTNVTEHWHERIHPRRGYRWRSPVHEYLRRDGPEQVRWLPDLGMEQRPDLTKDRSVVGSASLSMLQQAMHEEPGQWKIWWFAADEFRKAGKLDDARRILDACAKIEGADPTTVNNLREWLK